MKKKTTMPRGVLLAATVLVAAAVMLPAPASAGALFVELKNGSRFFVSGYWHRDNMISFEVAGGTLGFPEKSVKCVREVLAQDEIQLISLIEEEKQRRELEKAGSAVQTEIERLNGLEEQVVLAESQKNLEGQDESSIYHVPIYEWKFEDTQLASNATGDYRVSVDGLLTKLAEYDGVKALVFKYLGADDSVVAENVVHPEELRQSGKSEDGEVFRVENAIPADNNPKRVEISVTRFDSK